METFEQMIDRVTRQLDEEHLEGYRDGHDTDAIAPNDNRSAAYKHSWHIGRAEKEKRDPMPAALARCHADMIRSDAMREAMQLAGLMPA